MEKPRELMSHWKGMEQTPGNLKLKCCFSTVNVQACRGAWDLSGEEQLDDLAQERQSEPCHYGPVDKRKGDALSAALRKTPLNV